MVNVIIGLEIHVQLKTKSKIFCSCPTNYRDVEPNENLCPTCAAQPGSKPFGLNKTALDNLLKIALALNCRIRDSSIMQRKHYLYPDNPSGYQRTSKPIGAEGNLGTIRIREVHIEEDPGRYELREGTVDYNRAGIPLIEIVTEPDMRSPEDAREFLDELSAILGYLDVARDEPGSMRADANVSIDGGTRVEVKNINSFSGVVAALAYEIIRQQNVVRRGGKVIMETRHFEEASNSTTTLRKKETEEDYRYLPDPDVPPISVNRAHVAELGRKMPELPRAKAARLSKDFGIRPEDAWILVAEVEIANLFERMAKRAIPQKIALWIRGPLKKQLNYRELTLKRSGLKEEWLSELFGMFEAGEVSDKGMEQTLIALFEKKKSPKTIATEMDLLMTKDTKEIGRIIDTVVEGNPKSIADYKAGNEKALNFVVGNAIKLLKGRADSKLVRELVLKKIKEKK
ncbi:Aspartyl/glutamyl-tRNA(Asn/Gln) amidotransferase subunit B [uncultured archaeon]|nr:Aspartyl/glutamyl-tRNA(Asn/Gln) amidotransferase subunit B [uncultured archaeon]